IIGCRVYAGRYSKRREPWRRCRKIIRIAIPGNKRRWQFRPHTTGIPHENDVVRSQAVLGKPVSCDFEANDDLADRYRVHTNKFDRYYTRGLPAGELGRVWSTGIRQSQLRRTQRLGRDNLDVDD